jgi:hypothetical protein
VNLTALDRLRMQPTPVLPREEYVEQAYFFRVCRLRLAEGRPAQETLRQLQAELLSSTRMPLAVEFMLTELNHAGVLSDAFRKLPHYFTAFQAHVVAQSEVDRSRFLYDQAMLILEREAEYKAGAPTPAGLFIYQLETLTRNQLGYLNGLIAMEGDGLYDDDWRKYITFVRSQIGSDFAELVYVRSERYVQERRRSEPEYDPRVAILFPEKEGRIAHANIGRDPNYLFAALQRQLGFPLAPRPPKASQESQDVEELRRKVKALENKFRILEGEVLGRTDPSLFISKESNGGPTPRG